MRGGVLLARLAHFRRRVRRYDPQVPEKYMRAAELQFGWTFNKVERGKGYEHARMEDRDLVAISNRELAMHLRASRDNDDGVRNVARG